MLSARAGGSEDREGSEVVGSSPPLVYDRLLRVLSGEFARVWDSRRPLGFRGAKGRAAVAVGLRDGVGERRAEGGDGEGGVARFGDMTCGDCPGLLDT